MFIKEELEAMLREHPKNESKLTEIKLKAEEYQERLKYAGTVHQETDDEIIENMQLAGRGYDGVYSNTNATSDKTLNTVLKYHKEEQYINREDREFLERKIEEFNKIEDELNKKIVRVKNMLEQLSEDEEFVIRKFYMKKSKWDYVEKEYFDTFDIHKTVKQLQTYRDNALASMLEILNIGEG